MVSNSNKNSRSSKPNKDPQTKYPSFAERTRLRRSHSSIDSPEQKAVGRSVPSQAKSKKSSSLNYPDDYIRKNALIELENKERRLQASKRSQELESKRKQRAQERFEDADTKSRFSSSKQEQRFKKQRMRKIKQLSLLLVITLAIITASVLLFNFSKGSFFYPSEIEVSGFSALDSQRITELAAIQETSSILYLDSDQIAKKISAHPWVKQATVKKKLPHTIEIVITEREPIARVGFADDGVWLLSVDGFWLGKSAHKKTQVVYKDAKGKDHSIAYDSSKLIRITDTPDYSDRKAGQSSTSPEVNNARKIIGGVSPEFRTMIKSISAVSAPKTKIFTHEGIEIGFGTATEIVEKDRIASSIMKEQHGRVVLINVRAIDKPTWRGLSEEK